MNTTSSPNGIKIVTDSGYYNTPVKPQTPGSSGIDLRASETLTIPPKQRRLISTGFRVAMPVGIEGQVRPRSGLAYKHGLTVLNTPGTIDADYRDEVKVLLYNTAVPFTVEAGMRIAQIVFAPVAHGFQQLTVEEFESLPETARGLGGFGSTGTD